jgi:SAM-dependent methyltransferase
MTLRIDPNAPSFLTDRSDGIRQASRPLIKDRGRFLAVRVKSRDVLDIGCVNHSAETSSREDWLHATLAQHAHSCLGIDILENDIKALAAKGYAVQVWDVTKEPLPLTFDVIVCGELIEHISNPGGLFGNCKVMLRPGGCLYISTPNPWYINYLLKTVFSRRPIVENVDHVAWYEPCVLTELASRYGFRLQQFYGIQVTQTNTWKASVFFSFVPFMRAFGFRQEIFAKSILYEFVPEENQDADLSDDLDASNNHLRRTSMITGLF